MDLLALSIPAFLILRDLAILPDNFTFWTPLPVLWMIRSERYAWSVGFHGILRTLESSVSVLVLQLLFGWDCMPQFPHMKNRIENKMHRTRVGTISWFFGLNYIYIYICKYTGYYSQNGPKTLGSRSWGQSARTWALRSVSWTDPSTTVYRHGNLDNLTSLCLCFP